MNTIQMEIFLELAGMIGVGLLAIGAFILIIWTVHKLGEWL